MATIKLCVLRRVLDHHFEGDAGTVCRRLREAEMLPAGAGGRDGVGSAQVGPRDAAVALLGLASLAWAEPHETPREAARLAALKLPSGDVQALDCLAGELAAASGAIEGYSPAAWTVSRHHVHQQTLGLTFSDGAAGHGGVERSTTVWPALISDVAALFQRAGS